MERAPSDRDLPNPKRTESFAVRHPFLVHGILVLLCWGTYAFDRVDVVWRFIRDSTHARMLEHLGFALAALFIGLGIWLGAWPSGNPIRWASDARSIRRRSIGEILHAVGIASLLPLAGAVGLVVAEVIRSVHFAHLRASEIAGRSTGAPMSRPTIKSTRIRSTSGSAQPRGFLICHIAGISAFVSMLVFSITLRDRLADALFAVTALVFLVSRFINLR
jgi:hypothetical protein